MQIIIEIVEEAYGIIEAKIIIMKLECQSLQLGVIHNEVEDFFIVRILSVPNGPGTLSSLSHPNLYIGVYLAKQISTACDLVNFDDLHMKEQVEFPTAEWLAD